MRMFHIFDSLCKANLPTMNRFAITLLSEELSKGGFNQRLGKCIETVLESGAFSPRQ